MKLSALAVFLGLLVITGAAEIFREPDTGLRFPEKLGAWKREKVTTYPEANLGVSIGYNHDKGHAITLYLYSKGYAAVPSGGESALIQAEMNEIATAIEAAWKARGATVKPLLLQQEVRDNICPGVFALVSVHEITMPGGKLTSISGLTGYRNRILKLRYSYPGETMEHGLNLTSDFLRELLKENSGGTDPFFEAVIRENYPELRAGNRKTL